MIDVNKMIEAVININDCDIARGMIDLLDKGELKIGDFTHAVLDNDIARGMIDLIDVPLDKSEDMWEGKHETYECIRDGQGVLVVKDPMFHALFVWNKDMPKAIQRDCDDVRRLWERLDCLREAACKGK